MVVGSLHFCQKVSVRGLWVAIKGGDDPLWPLSTLHSQYLLRRVFNSVMMELQKSLNHVALQQVERYNVLSIQRCCCLRVKRFVISSDLQEVPS